jgi:hypothetical protein
LHQRQGGPIDFEEGGAETAHHKTGLGAGSSSIAVRLL